MDMEKEVALIYPEGIEVTLQKEKVLIKPLYFGQFPKALKIMANIDLGEGETPQAIDIVEVFAKNADAVLDLCALCAEKERTFFDKVPADEAINLISAIIKVNADFFVKRLRLPLHQLVEGLSGLVGGASSQS